MRQAEAVRVVICIGARRRLDERPRDRGTISIVDSSAVDWSPLILAALQLVPVRALARHQLVTMGWRDVRVACAVLRTPRGDRVRSVSSATYLAEGGSKRKQRRNGDGTKCRPGSRRPRRVVIALPTSCRRFRQVVAKIIVDEVFRFGQTIDSGPPLRNGRVWGGLILHLFIHPFAGAVCRIVAESIATHFRRVRRCASIR
jgi:hypothetical protein